MQMLSFKQYQELIRRRFMKIKLLVVLSLVLLTASGMEDIARAQGEITELVTVSLYATGKTLPLGPHGTYIAWESYGVVISETAEGLFHGATNRCVGAFFSAQGTVEGEGYCSFTLKDGEKVFASLKTGAKAGGPSKGAHKILGGTGKYSGIQGETEVTSYPLRSSSEGASQSYNKLKIRYRLPK